MSVENNNKGRSLQWLPGRALIAGDVYLPLMACASKSALRALGPDAGADVVPFDTTRVTEGAGLRLIFNDDHGMMPSVTIVNQTDAPVTLCAVRPSILSTDNGTYDLDALLADRQPTIEPGSPLVIRITDIGRNADEPFRLSSGKNDPVRR